MSWFIALGQKIKVKIASASDAKLTYEKCMKNIRYSVICFYCFMFGIASHASLSFSFYVLRFSWFLRIAFANRKMSNKPTQENRFVFFSLHFCFSFFVFATSVCLYNVPYKFNGFHLGWISFFTLIILIPFLVSLCLCFVYIFHMENVWVFNLFLWKICTVLLF